MKFTIQILASLTTYIEINGVEARGETKGSAVGAVRGNRYRISAGERVYLPSRAVRFSQLFLTRGSERNR